MMEILEFFLGGFIANVLGLYTRYLFFRLIGKRKSIKYLSGEFKDQISNISNNFLNTTVGLIVLLLLLLFVGIAYLVYS